MNVERREIILPFQGFYESLYTEAIDHEESGYADNISEDECLSNNELSALYDLLFDRTNYRQAYRELAHVYVSAFNEKFKEWTGIDLCLKFVELVSPREYNFETDRIFATTALEALQTLRTTVDERFLREQIRTRHSSRSGFISFYSNKLEEWPSEVSEWDCNQLCTLVMCFLPEDWEIDVYYKTCDNESAYKSWEKLSTGVPSKIF